MWRRGVYAYALQRGEGRVFSQIEKPQFPCFGEYPCNKRLRKTAKYWMDDFWNFQVYMDRRFLNTVVVYFKTEKHLRNYW